MNVTYWELSARLRTLTTDTRYQHMVTDIEYERKKERKKERHRERETRWHDVSKYNNITNHPNKIYSAFFHLLWIKLNRIGLTIWNVWAILECEVCQHNSLLVFGLCTLWWSLGFFHEHYMVLRSGFLQQSTRNALKLVWTSLVYVVTYFVVVMQWVWHLVNLIYMYLTKCVCRPIMFFFCFRKFTILFNNFNKMLVVFQITENDINFKRKSAFRSQNCILLLLSMHNKTKKALNKQDLKIGFFEWYFFTQKWVKTS